MCAPSDLVQHTLMSVAGKIAGQANGQRLGAGGAVQSCSRQIRVMRESLHVTVEGHLGPSVCSANRARASLPSLPPLLHLLHPQKRIHPPSGYLSPNRSGCFSDKAFVHLYYGSSRWPYYKNVLIRTAKLNLGPTPPAMHCIIDNGRLSHPKNLTQIKRPLRSETDPSGFRWSA